ELCEFVHSSRQSLAVDLMHPISFGFLDAKIDARSHDYVVEHVYSAILRGESQSMSLVSKRVKTRELDVFSASRIAPAKVHYLKRGTNSVWLLQADRMRR